MAQDKPLVEKVAEVEQYGAYHLVTFGQWQVTVDNAGDIKLPAMVTPELVDDLIGALVAAAPVARGQRENNVAAQVQMNAFVKAQREKAEEAARNAHAAVNKPPRGATPAKRAAAKRPQPSKVGGTRRTAAKKASKTTPRKTHG